MNSQELMRQVARLESMNDHLLAEIGEIDQLMRLLGFVEGINTLKQSARELCDSEM